MHAAPGLFSACALRGSVVGNHQPPASWHLHNGSNLSLIDTDRAEDFKLKSRPLTVCLLGYMHYAAAYHSPSPGGTELFSSVKY